MSTNPSLAETGSYWGDLPLLPFQDAQGRTIGYGISPNGEKQTFNMPFYPNGPQYFERATDHGLEEFSQMVYRARGLNVEITPVETQN